MKSTRRDFLRAVGVGGLAAALPRVVGADSLLSSPANPSRPVAGGGLDFSVPREYPGQRGPKTMLFWDYWKLHQMNNIELVQGKPVWVREGTYADGGGGRVYFDRAAGLWRRISAYNDFYIHESEDGIRWRPADLPGMKPDGSKKKAPHHVFTLPGQGSAPGWLYLDPVAADGYPYKIPVTFAGERSYEQALANSSHRWHAAASQLKKPRPYIMEHVMLVSKDGLSWEIRREYNWSQGRFNPEEPHFMFYNHLTGQHTLTCRPGFADRRVCITTTEDFRTWSEPRLVLQPDFADEKILEFYAMPVFPYGTQFIGLVWVSHFATSHDIDIFMLHRGPREPQLTASSDGQNFARLSRAPFINLNEPGEAGCHAICPEGMVVLDDQIRIYSISSVSAHGTPVPDEMKRTDRALVLHTLRRDGFTYFQSKGHWGEFTTRPFTIFDGELTVNAMAPTGEVRFEVRDDFNKPVENYSFEDSIPLRFGDSLRHPLAWKNRRNMAELIGKTFRLGVRFYNARIYSFRGDYHFTDVTDTWGLQDGFPIEDTSRFGT